MIADAKILFVAGIHFLFLMLKSTVMTLYWHMDVLPKITGIAISVFDVDDFEMPQESIWEEFKRPWVEFGLQLKHLHGQSD